MGRMWLVSGAVLGFLSVAGGAFGAHALKERLGPEMLANFETGARYQMYHALALLGVGLVSMILGSRAGGLMRASGWCFLLGTVIFSGSLYGLSLSGIKKFGMITPIGGLGLLAGWLLLAIGSASLSRGGLGE